MRMFATTLLATALLALPLAAATAQTYESVEGPYVNAALVVGIPSAENSTVSDNLGAQVGFAVAGGYRFNGWLGTDAELYYAGGGDITGSSANTSSIGVTINAKFYPMALIAPDAFTQALQPYLVTGMGGGKVMTDLAGLDTGGGFLFRIGGGTEYLFTENWGAYVDLSYHVTTQKWMSGVGVFQFGAAYHF